MNFTSKVKLGFVACGILITAAATALIGWASHLILAPAPIVTMRDTFAKQDSIRTSDHLQINRRGVALTQSPDLRANRAEYYQTIAWYNSKHWWKKNAPVVGGAAGGALIGGLAGGGTGAIIGGAAGGGGGYLYKHFKDHDHHQERHQHHDHYHQ
jgi:hypothetical protein